MEAYHLTAGARGSLPLVRDDEDRYALLEEVGASLGALVLAYCVMGTHLHLVVEGPSDQTRRWLEAGLARYLRGFNRRHDGGGVLRGPVADHAVPGAEELARTIRYLHENPVRTQPPIVDRAVDFPWSSARAFAGLSLAPVANVARALDLVGPFAWKVAGHAPPLADLARAAVPGASPDTLLAAAADVYGVRPWELPSPKRAPALATARATFLELGKLEGYSLRQLAPFLERTHQQASNLTRAAGRLDDALRIGRTLLRDAGLRRRLPRQNCQFGKSRAPSRTTGR